LTGLTSKGQYFDYSPYWYNDIGLKICITMCINVMVPVGSTCAMMWKAKVERWYDSKGTGDRFVTRCTNMTAYKLVHSGDNYLIYLKFAESLNIVYTCMMYGMGIPILFPIAAVALFNSWACERYLMAKEVKLPPAMNN